MTDQDLLQGIREVLDDLAGLAVPASTLAANADLFAAGMTSYASVSLMLGLEEKLDVTFTDAMLNRQNFESIEAIAAAITRARGGAPD